MVNLAATIELYGGGPGSGCNPRVGKCGRPKGTGETVEHVQKKIEHALSTENWGDEGDWMTFDFDNNARALSVSTPDVAGIVMADGEAIIGHGLHGAMFYDWAGSRNSAIFDKMNSVLEHVTEEEDIENFLGTYVDTHPGMVRWGWGSDEMVYMQIGKPDEKALNRVEDLLDVLPATEFELSVGKQFFVGSEKLLKRKLNELRRRRKT